MHTWTGEIVQQLTGLLCQHEDQSLGSWNPHRMPSELGDLPIIPVLNNKWDPQNNLAREMSHIDELWV